MSGIYIPNMEMPTNEPLIIKINPDGSVSTTWKNGYKKYEAVPVPDHGRLIDADAHNEALEKHRNTYAQDHEFPWGITLDAFEWELAQVPTIIPADKEAT